ncbi:MAG: hypothetical protein M3417_09365, partial [Actinomycetota bacterium]|nr:hypothetical protein [Actinomycetota bacterium]
IRVGRGPADIAVGAGAVWVANADGGSVSRIDPRTGRAAQIPVGVRQVLALAIGEGGVWVARAGGLVGDRVQVVRIDPRERKVMGDAIAVPGAVPLDLVAGHGIWVTDAGASRSSARGGRGGVTRIDPGSGRIAAALRVGERPSAIALGAGGVWVANEGDGTVSLIAVAQGR